ncbi:MAG: SPOR domain-containing protein [Bacteroidia bacterium]|nr:SPOR domain-containing protein [Bacteroidia bacterium]
MKYLFVSIGLSSLLLAQNTWQDLRPQFTSQALISAERPRLREPAPFQVEWRASPPVQNLYEKVLQNLRSATTLPGYRIQVLTTTSRQAADSLRFHLLETFITTGIYMIYESPSYKIRVGDFLDRKEAEAWLERHGREFPGAFIVPDKVLRP